MSSLLDPKFIAELEALARRVKLLARSRHSGVYQARRSGSSAEFEDHKTYSEGDDPRHIDWRVFARTGQIVVKRFRSEENPLVRILLDSSASSSFGEPQKLEYQKRLTAALGYVALSTGGRVELYVGAGSPPLQRYEIGRARSGLSRLLHSLDSLTPNAHTDLDGWLEELCERSRRPAHLLVLSDFLTPALPVRRLKQAGSLGHQISLFQVLAPQETQPELSGQLLLQDLETDEELELTLNHHVVTRYKNRLQNLCGKLKSWADASAQSYFRCTTDTPLGYPLREFVQRHSL